MYEISRRTFLQWTMLSWFSLFTWLDLNQKKDFCSIQDILLDVQPFELTDLEILNKASISANVTNTKKRVFITIDDGPTKLLIPYANELEKYWHRWIFFFIWWLIKNHKKDIIEILNRWHQVANHSWKHPMFSRLSLVEAKNEIIKTDYILREVISWSKQNPNQLLLFRYPYWDPIQKKYREDFAKFLREKSYFEKPLMWDLDTNDWKKTQSIKDIIDIAEKTKEEKVVLIHERQKTFEALKILLKRFYDSNRVWTVKI